MRCDMLALSAVLVLATSALAHTCPYGESVQLTDRSYNGHKYEDGEYFVDNTTGLERGCVCMKQFCARKCCPYGQGYNSHRSICVDMQEMFDPPVFNAPHLLPAFNVSQEFHFLFYKMECTQEGEVRIAIGGLSDFNLITNGSLHVQVNDNKSVFYGPDKYCIDNFVAVSDQNTSTTQLNAIICYTPAKQGHRYALNSSCMLISCFFILLTVGVYAWLPELRNLHGMVLMAYLLSFFVGFVFLAALQILILLKNNINAEICLTFTFIIYYSLLAAFFWMNVMCYDIWWTFSGNRSMMGHRSSVRRQFVSYSLYAFGVPTALTVLLAVLEFTVDPNKSILLPRIRAQRCFIFGYSKLLYLYLPIVLMCVANLVFFTLTALKIAEIKKQTQVLNKKDKNRFSLYIKLFIVMGINWILEVISSFYPKAEYIWQFTDAYNVLVGLIIFIIFVCKPNILKKIKDRCQEQIGRPLFRKQTNSTSMSTQTTNSNDQGNTNATIKN